MGWSCWTTFSLGYPNERNTKIVVVFRIDDRYQYPKVLIPTSTGLGSITSKSRGTLIICNPLSTPVELKRLSGFNIVCTLISEKLVKVGLTVDLLSIKCR